MSPFVANLSFHPRIKVGVKQVSSAEASLMAQDLDSLHQHLKEQLCIMLTTYEEATDHQRLPAPLFNVGTSVWFDARNIQTTRPAKKLDHKRLGPSWSPKSCRHTLADWDSPTPCGPYTMFFRFPSWSPRLPTHTPDNNQTFHHLSSLAMNSNGKSQP